MRTAILGNYLIGLRQSSHQPRSRALLVVALAINLGALAVFKYLGLLDQSADSLARLLGLGWAVPAVHIILPLGLSFFTFEFIHYQMDLFRGGAAIRQFYLVPNGRVRACTQSHDSPDHSDGGSASWRCY